MSNISSNPTGNLARIGTYTLSEESESDEDDVPTVSKPSQAETVKSSDLEPSASAPSEEAVDNDDEFGFGFFHKSDAEPEEKVAEPIENKLDEIPASSPILLLDDNKNSEILQIPKSPETSQHDQNFLDVADSPLESLSRNRSETPNPHDLGFQTCQNSQVQSPETSETPGRSRSPASRQSNADNIQCPMRSASPENAFGVDTTASEESQNLNIAGDQDSYENIHNNVATDEFNATEGTSQQFDAPLDFGSPLRLDEPYNEMNMPTNSNPESYQNLNFDDEATMDVPDSSTQNLDFSKTPEPTESLENLDVDSGVENMESTSEDLAMPLDSEPSENLDVAGSSQAEPEEVPMETDLNVYVLDNTSKQKNAESTQEVMKSTEAVESPNETEIAEKPESPVSLAEAVSTPVEAEVTEKPDSPAPSTESVPVSEAVEEAVDTAKSPEAVSNPTETKNPESPAAPSDNAVPAEEVSGSLSSEGVEKPTSPVESEIKAKSPESSQPEAITETLETLSSSEAAEAVEVAKIPEAAEKPESPCPSTQNASEIQLEDKPDTPEQMEQDLEVAKTPEAVKEAEESPMDEAAPADVLVAEDHQDLDPRRSPENPVAIEPVDEVQNLQNFEDEMAEVIERPERPRAPINLVQLAPEARESPEIQQLFGNVNVPQIPEAAPFAPTHRIIAPIAKRPESRSPPQLDSPDRPHNRSPPVFFDLDAAPVEPPPEIPRTPETAPMPEKATTPEVERESSAEPMEERVAEPVAEPLMKPVTEPVAEPMVDVKKSPESVAESPEASQSTSDTVSPAEPKEANPKKEESPTTSRSPSPGKLESPVMELTPVKDERAKPPHLLEKKSEPPKKKAGRPPAAAAKKSDSESDSSDSDDDDEPMSKVAMKKAAPNGKPGPTSGGNPWESPRQEPVGGVVQPRTEPPKGKPTRHTNCLDHLLFTVIKEAVKHKHSWPFQEPVNAVALAIPDYHKTITRPMDLRTIEKRLRNSYYWSVDDAIKDLNTLFQNCKTFNDNNDDIYIMCENVEGVVLRGLECLPAKEVEADFPEHLRKAMFPRAGGPGKPPKTPSKRGRKSTRGRKKGMPPRSATSYKDESVDDYDDGKTDSFNYDEDEDEELSITPVKTSAKNTSISVQPVEVEEVKPVLASPPAKKRKAENGEVATPAKVAAPAPAPTPAPPSPVVASPAPTPAAVPATPVTPAPPRKNPNSMIDWKRLPPRWTGKQAEWQKFCVRLLNEMHSLKNKSFAQVFYVPVDPIKLKIADYLDVVKNPMDLQTMKKKLDHKQYAEPEEFVADMNLMIDNCCLYNPKGSSVYQNALDLKALFEQRWKLFPSPGVDPIVSDSYIHQNLIVNTDYIEDERINGYLSAVREEEKKCAEKLEKLRSMSDGLYNIKLQRRDARLAGNIAPMLEPNQMAELEQLGISIKNTAVLVPELISPATSVRSSARAPVPKIIDDIGPSPTKARKISKPRQSLASNASTAAYPTPTGNPRGRKPKKRPIKQDFSPAYEPLPRTSAAPKIVPVGPRRYVSVYNRTEVSMAEKVKLTQVIADMEPYWIMPILRIIQLSQEYNKQDIITLKTLCEDEIQIDDVPDHLFIEVADYVQMFQTDREKALSAKERYETEAKIHGFTVYDGLSVVPKSIPFSKLKRLDTHTPSPSASRTGVPSSDSDSDSGSESGNSSDSEGEPQPKKKAPTKKVVRRRAIEISASSSRASTPVAPNPVGRPPKAKSANVAPQKHQLSESSSSSDSSSDSSDSESETKAQVGIPGAQKGGPPGKKLGLKGPPVKQPPPQKPKGLSILDELLPETPAKQPPTPSTSRPIARGPSHDQKAPVSEAEHRLQKEQQHAEALRLQAQARRQREQREQDSFNNQAEVMAEFEFNDYY
ncbi:hypothetical protein L3Y34_011252 [Caenorhabditis briggsae]|uniref:Bromo domain-containing protein n=1 Tax=Caenorhabditis briggsae TaxID=6238 RepID=A0AAE8ZSF1_CAEBR|nr:hypothetical protein L3Y34_011252 [Caenorhabditis briggsae]